jgi:glycosyltransferase involved in cell wall biosynthesis
MYAISYLFLEPYRAGHGGYTHAKEIINGLKDLKCQIQFYTPNYNPDKSLPGAVGRLWKFLVVQLSLLFNLRKNKIIYIRTHFAAMLVAVVARLLKITVIQEINGPLEDIFVHWRRFGLLKKLIAYSVWTQLSLADGIITVTPQLKKIIEEKILNKKVKLIPCGANVELFKPNLPRPNDIRLPNTYAVFFGSYTYWQGIDLILESLKYPEWPGDVEMVFMGQGPENNKVDCYSQKCPKFHNVGFIEYEKIGSIISNSLCSIIPKNNCSNRRLTGLAPIKLYESLASGVPIIATNFPFQADIIRDSGAGIIISFDDPSAVCQAVKYLLENPEERMSMGIKARQEAVQNHSWQHRAAATLYFIRECHEIDQKL